MNDAIPVAVCRRCEHVSFPDRLLCPRCGFSEWARGWISRGMLEEATVVRRAPGGPVAPVGVGTVQLTSGPKVVARIEPDVAAGCAVRLSYDDGVPVARAEPAPPAGERS